MTKYIPTSLLHCDRYKDAKEIYKSPKYNMTYSDRDGIVTLTIKDVAQRDSGRYRLEINNRYGHDDTECRLQVIGKFTMLAIVSKI